MARQLVTAQRPSPLGAEILVVPASVDGEAYYLSPRTAIIIDNTAGTVATVVTLITPVVTQAGAIPDPTINIPIGKRYIIGGLAAALYQQDDGTVWAGCVPFANVKIGVIES